MVLSPRHPAGPSLPVYLVTSIHPQAQKTRRGDLLTPRLEITRVPCCEVTPACATMDLQCKYKLGGRHDGRGKRGGGTRWGPWGDEPRRARAAVGERRGRLARAGANPYAGAV